MKAQMLKIAGVKSEKEFYKKFPDEASFMKAHGKEFKKAMRASKITKEVPKAQNALTIGGGGPSLAGATNVGPSGGYSFMPSSGFNSGTNIDQSWNKKLPKEKTNYNPYIQAGSDVVRGISMIKQQKQQVKRARQMADLTGVQAAAAASMPIEPIKRQYNRPEDTVIQPDQLFPSQGVGTNVLAEDGAVINQIGGNPTEIMNTFAPNTIYSDMGYEPLSDSDKVKQFAGGGQLAGMLNDSKFGDIMNQGGANVLNQLGTAITGEEDAGTAIGGGIGQAAGNILLPGIGGKLGKFPGKIIGDLVDQSERKIETAQKQTGKNRASIMGSQFGAGIQSMYSANMRGGGYIPKAQGGSGVSTERGECAANPFQNVKEGAMDYGAPATKAELYPTRYKSLYSVMPSDRKERKAVIEAFNQLKTTGTSPYLKDYSPEDYQAAIYEANVYNRYFGQPGVEKMFDPSTGAVLSDYTSQVNNPTVSFYRSKFPQAKSITPEQVINLMPLSERKSLIGRGYKQENGGQTSEYKWVSHTWQPQKIAFFGEHKLSDLLKPPADADMLRAGGEIRNLRKNYMSPEEEMMTNMAFGGQLKTTWGGHAEPISQNPYLPGTGQTVMFRGQSHDESDGKGRTGIGVKYGKPDSYTDYAEYGTEADADVEVERNEPAVELPNGDGDNSMVVYGNLKIPNQFLHEIGDPKAKGKKFKTYVKDLSKKEQRQNKIIDKASEQLDDLNPISPFDRLKFNSLAANIEGANMKLKEYAEFKQNAAAVQNAINDTAEEMGLDADKLAKGKVAMAKRGANIPKAQGGQFVPTSTMFLPRNLITPSEPSAPPATTAAQVTAPAAPTRRTATSTQTDDGGYKSKYGLKPWPGNVTGLGKKTASSFSAQEWDEIADKLGFKGRGNKEFQEFLLKNPQSKPLIEARHKQLYGKDPFIDSKLGYGWAAEDLKKLTGTPTREVPKQDLVPLKSLEPSGEKKTETTTTQSTTYPSTKYKENPFLEAIAAALPYLRESDVEELDPAQLMGELYALSQNVVEPVWAQKLTPRLSVPMDISLQDILNENRATLRRQQQILGYNPAAQSAFAAQEYGANQRVLGEQFRLNQAEKQRVYEQNRNILNQYDLANMGILDKQYERQATALSKTKATTQEALNSIASKIAQNRLENRTLATMENLYNYRFDPAFRAINYQVANWNIPGGSTASTTKETPVYGPDGKTILYYKTSSSDIPSLATPPINVKKGGSVKKRKDALNSTVVKALKNL